MYLFEFFFSGFSHLRVGLLYHIGVLFLAFWVAFILFSVVVVPTYIPTISEGGFPLQENLLIGNYHRCRDPRGSKAMAFVMILFSSIFASVNRPVSSAQGVQLCAWGCLKGGCKVVKWEITAGLADGNGFLEGWLALNTTVCLGVAKSLRRMFFKAENKGRTWNKEELGECLGFTQGSVQGVPVVAQW